MGRESREEIRFQDKELENLIKIFCKNVQKLRSEQGFTQQQLAEKSKLSVNTIAEIEQQRIENLRLGTITALEKALGIDTLSSFKK